MENALEIKGLCKQYTGFALDNVSFSLPRGAVMGLSLIHIYVGGRLLQLHRDALGDRHALDLAGLKDLHHNNICLLYTS